VFLGDFRHAIDEKGRLAVPARFRGQLTDGCVVVRWIENCLAVYPMADWEVLAAKVKALPFTDPNARLLQRQLFAMASEETLDKQGRILIPAGLREFAGLGAEAKIVGSLDHAEIWAPERWDDYAKGLNDPSAFSQAISGLGI